MSITNIKVSLQQTLRGLDVERLKVMKALSALEGGSGLDAAPIDVPVSRKVKTPTPVAKRRRPYTRRHVSPLARGTAYDVFTAAVRQFKPNDWTVAQLKAAMPPGVPPGTIFGLLNRGRDKGLVACIGKATWRTIG